MIQTEKIRPEIYPLTGIRAMAALWVVLFHMQAQFVQAWPPFRTILVPLVAPGYLGVDLFFVLSGFIIYYNYAQRLSEFRVHAVGEFLWMRLARLWPVHGTILGMFVILITVQRALHFPKNSSELYTFWGFVRNVFLVHGWSIPLRISWNAPAWSISCEWLAYLCFPILILSRFCSTSARLSSLTALVALFGTAAACQVVHDDGNSKYGLIRIAGEFIGGCSCCHLFRLRIAERLPWQILTPVSLLGVLTLTCYILPRLGLVGYWCVPLLGLLILGLAHHRCFVSRVLATKPLLFGGYISYSVYMVHELVLVILSRVEPSLGAFAPFLEVCAIVAAATVLFYLVEEPCRKWMRAFFPRHRQQPYPVI